MTERIWLSSSVSRGLAGTDGGPSTPAGRNGEETAGRLLNRDREAHRPPVLEEADGQACVQYVITAMHDERRARGSVRISVGRANEGKGIDETGR